MFTGRVPWQDVSDPVSAVYRVGFTGDVPEIPGFLSEQGRDFVSKCLKRDPNERWCVDELLRHEFVEESISFCFMIEFGGLKLDTPTCVIDGSMWDSWDPTRDLTRVCSFNSCRDRILMLCDEATASFDGNDMNWGGEEGWITVRNGNEMKENYDIDLGNEGSLVCCYEPRTGITVGLCMCSLDCCMCSVDYKVNGCREGLLLGCYDWSCVRIIIVWKREIEYQKKEILFIICFSLSLSHSLLRYHG